MEILTYENIIDELNQYKSNKDDKIIKINYDFSSTDNSIFLYIKSFIDNNIELEIKEEIYHQTNIKLRKTLCNVDDVMVVIHTLIDEFDVVMLLSVYMLESQIQQLKTIALHVEHQNNFNTPNYDYTFPLRFKNFLNGITVNCAAADEELDYLKRKSEIMLKEQIKGETNPLIIDYFKRCISEEDFKKYLNE